MNRLVRIGVGGVALVVALGALAGVHDTVPSIRDIFVHEKPHATILFGGDMLFDRTVRTYAEKFGDDYLFQCLDPLFSQADLVVANLEGPITDNPSRSQFSEPGDGDNYTFTFPTSTATLLYRHNVQLVSLGNNHIMNFSRDGLVQTEHYLDAAQVAHFGDPDKPESERVARIVVHGIPFSFVNWSDWTSDKTDHTVAQVRAEKTAGRVVVVYSHWGDEYAPPPERVRQLAHSFVDAGAALIIGSHPHVVQEMELYHGTRIYYSLGNLIFDQYWEPAVMNGLLVRATFDAQGAVETVDIPVVLQHNRQTCPLAQE